MITKPFAEEIRSIFAEYASSVPEAAMLRNRGTIQAYAKNAEATAIVPQYKFQNTLRPLFGKGIALPPSIGDHPDFEHLRGTGDSEFCAISTMFMDMEGSTRLNLLHSVEDVARIKNAFICMAIEVVKAFDGHVHRIMGDAVMAYFGGKGAHADSAAIDAVNCAAVLQLLVRDSVVPYLEKEGFGNEFGIRIGVDHGPEDRVLWRSYGYPGMEEVTATSFYVDVASKLQHAAGRNEVVIGNSLRELIDFPEVLLDVKVVIRGGVPEKQPYLTPNLNDSDGKPINYRQHLLKWSSYLETSPLAGKLIGGDSASLPKVDATLHSSREGAEEGPFIPAGTLGAKMKVVRFRIAKLPYLPQLPYTVKCIVENHGEEARKASENSGNHETVYEIKTQADHKDILHWEPLAYRGLHYLTVEIRTPGKLLHSRRFGVYVE